MADVFEPKVVEGPFSDERERFLFQGGPGGPVNPLEAWADVCGVDYPRDDARLTHRQLEKKGALPLNAKEIEAACRDAFGDPRAKQDRGFPGRADWILTTPMEGVYLTVNIRDERVLRFGWGEVMDLAAHVSPCSVKAAITETLKSIRAAMEPEPAPSP